jgi:hypothetical protein
MLMLVIENETWCIHAPAREQLVNHLLEFIWPQRTVIKNNFRDYVSAFVEARVRHFRDSVARHFREKAKQRAQRDTPSSKMSTLPNHNETFCKGTSLCVVREAKLLTTSRKSKNDVIEFTALTDSSKEATSGHLDVHPLTLPTGVESR